MTKRKNSRAKGCRGELQASKFLTSIGFPCSRMGRNGRTAADLDLSKCELRNIHLEVKCRETMQLGSKALDDAMKQTKRDAPRVEVQTGYDPLSDTAWLKVESAVLWKRNRTCWRLSYICPHLGHRVTVDTREGIAAALKMLNTKGSA